MDADVDLLPVEWRDEALMLVRVFVAGLAGGIIGFERKYSGKRAGIRTVSMVAFGAGMFTALSIFAFPGADTSRMAAQVASGVGFLGAGTIIRRNGDVHGLTTAAAIWVAASLGAAAGAGLLILAVGGALLASLALSILPHDSTPEPAAVEETGADGGNPFSSG